MTQCLEKNENFAEHEEPLHYLVNVLWIISLYNRGGWSFLDRILCSGVIFNVAGHVTRFPPLTSTKLLQSEQEGK